MDGAFTAGGALEGKLTVKRGHVHQTPVLGRFIYSVGGRTNNLSTVGTIDVGTIE